MSLAEDYRMILLYKIYPTIESAMPAMGEGLKKAINEESSEYDGPYSRPKLFGDGTYSVFHDALSVTVWNRTQMQGTDYGVPEVEFVEGGYPEYNMPGPRPFMEEAGQRFADGEGSTILQQYLDSI